MKVLMTVDAVGGVWTYARELALALAPHRVHIIMAVMGPAPSKQQLEELRRTVEVDLVQRDFALEWMRDPWSDVTEAGDWLLQLADEFDVDVVHLNGYAHAVLPWRAPCLIVAHSCVATWWQAVHGEPAPREWNEYRRRVLAGLRAAAHVVAPTQAFLLQLETQYGRLPKSSVIYNSIRPFSNACSQSREGQDGDAPQNAFILTAGRLWDKAKNIATLDAAAKGLPGPVLVAGENALDGEKQTLRHARALGKLEAGEMREYLQRASIFASASVYEPFGLAILEAAAHRCALVLSDIDTLRELWSDAALFVDPRAPSAWHEALQKLIADPKRRAQLAAAAYERACQFNPAHMGVAYFSLYRRLCRFAERRAATANPAMEARL